jgi:hypothetical protein
MRLSVGFFIVKKSETIAQYNAATSLGTANRTLEVILKKANLIQTLPGNDLST